MESKITAVLMKRARSQFPIYFIKLNFHINKHQLSDKGNTII